MRKRATPPVAGSSGEFNFGNRDESVKVDLLGNNNANFLENILKILDDTFDPNSCLHENKRACGMCLCFFWVEKMFFCCFHCCLPKSRCVRDTYRCTSRCQVVWEIPIRATKTPKIKSPQNH